MKKKVLINLFATTLVLASLPTISNFSNWEVTAFAQEHIIDNNSGITSFGISNSHNIKLGTPLTLTPTVVKGSSYNSVSWKIKYDFGTNSKLIGNVLTPSSTGNVIITGTLTTNTGTYQKDFMVCVTKLNLKNGYTSAWSGGNTTLTLSEGYSGVDTQANYSINCYDEAQYNLMAYLEGGDSDLFEIVKSPPSIVAKNVYAEFTVQLKEGLPAGTYSTYITICSTAAVGCDPKEITIIVKETAGSSPTNTTTQATTQATTQTTTELTTQATTQYTTTQTTTELTTQATTQYTTTQTTTELTTQATTQTTTELTTQTTTTEKNWY